MKIVVYAICKNEEQFVDRWMDSMSEADEIVVLDTGSSEYRAAAAGQGRPGGGGGHISLAL